GKLLDIKRGQYRADGLTITLPVASRDKAGRASAISLPVYQPPLSTKNTAGYFIRPDMDLIDLFIGSEGTLGIIAGATLKVIPRARERLAFYLFFKDRLDCFALADELRQSEEVDPVCIEFYDRHSLLLLRKHYGNIPANAEACLYVEQWLPVVAREVRGAIAGGGGGKGDGGSPLRVSLGTEDDLLATWGLLLEKLGLQLLDQWCAQTEKEHAYFEAIRHNMPERVNELVAQYGQLKISMDFALPGPEFSRIYELYEQVIVPSGIEWLSFGHLGDHHLHLNLLPKNSAEYKLGEEIYLKLAREVIRVNGTVSAEHGIGKLKHRWLELMYGPEVIAQMRSLKNSFDPKMILNKGNLFTAA
ncbi:MAG: FAD-binding oxidoreductase, partial [Candidatus Margulisiibacteriota bacterium]